MRSPISIEPMHAFSYGHHRLRQMARGRLHTYDDEVAQDGAHTCQHALLTSLQFDIRDSFYSRATAVKSRYPLTSAI